MKKYLKLMWTGIEIITVLGVNWVIGYSFESMWDEMNKKH